jgi:hypothetical protein
MKYINKLQMGAEYNIISKIDKKGDIINITNLIIAYYINNKISTEEYYTNFYKKFDIFSLGIILDNIFISSCKFSKHIDDKTKYDIKLLIAKMTEASHLERIELKDAAIEYKKILVDNNILSSDELVTINRTFNIHFGQ